MEKVNCRRGAGHRPPREVAAHHVGQLVSQRRPQLLVAPSGAISRKQHRRDAANQRPQGWQSPRDSQSFSAPPNTELPHDILGKHLRPCAFSPSGTHSRRNRTPYTAPSPAAPIPPPRPPSPPPNPRPSAIPLRRLRLHARPSTDRTASFNHAARPRKSKPSLGCCGDSSSWTVRPRISAFRRIHANHVGTRPALTMHQTMPSAATAPAHKLRTKIVPAAPAAAVAAAPGPRRPIAHAAASPNSATTAACTTHQLTADS